MLLLKMVIIPISLWLLGAIIMLTSPSVTLLLAGCGLASAVLYSFTPYCTTYGFKPYLVVCGSLVFMSGGLMLIGYTGAVAL